MIGVAIKWLCYSAVPRANPTELFAGGLKQRINEMLKPKREYETNENNGTNERYKGKFSLFRILSSASINARP